VTCWAQKGARIEDPTELNVFDDVKGDWEKWTVFLAKGIRVCEMFPIRCIKVLSEGG
jgi:hypothetical protein